ncbi:MAG: hypothetical protein H6741_01870 [Alphaproteobacteria bacterium]|nr:hypothetical protein [Alphaproteobacteria bacterium]MCB9791450.1 hypothetical protein [Alphaproteobacteria bacterium]
MKRDERGRREPGPIAPPLVNLVSILLPLGAALGALAHTAQTSPETIPGLCERISLEACPKPPPPPPSLQLTVVITGRGFTVASRHGVLSPERVEDEGASLPCADGACVDPGSYDYAGLVRVLKAARAELPGEDTLTISPAGTVPYGVLVRTMDAAQGEGLFPFVTVSRGRL